VATGKAALLGRRTAPGSSEAGSFQLQRVGSTPTAYRSSALLLWFFAGVPVIVFFLPTQNNSPRTIQHTSLLILSHNKVAHAETTTNVYAKLKEQ